MELRYPASGPPWLRDFGSSIIRLFKGLMDAPFRLWPEAAADLPTAADFTGGLVWNRTSLTINWSDGMSWKAPQPANPELDALAAMSGTGLVARTGAGAFALRSIAGTANEIAVSNGGGVLGAPTLSLPSALTYTGKTVTGGTFSGIALSGTTTAPGNTIIDSAGKIGILCTPLSSSTPLQVSLGVDRRFTVFNSGGSNLVAFLTDAGNYASTLYSGGPAIIAHQGAARARTTSTGLSVDSGFSYQVNGTQVVTARQAAVADATGAGDVVAQLNTLLARLRTHGLIAS